MNILFISWDGPQVSYLESLFLPIFEALVPKGYRFSVLQFTWGGREHIESQRRACAEAGVNYRNVHIWRQPGGVGPFASALLSAGTIRKAVRDWQIGMLMPRSLMPAFAVLRANRRLKLPAVFDADGLMADERVDFAGLSSSSAVYRLLRDIEAEMVRQAKVTLVRTEAAATILLHRAGPRARSNTISVVTNGRDPAIYHPHSPEERASVRKGLGIEENVPLLVYCGSLGHQYCLPEMLRLHQTVREFRSDSRLLFLTGSPEKATAEIRRLSPEQRDRIIVKTVKAADVSSYLAAGDLGLAFRVDAFSTKAVRPIKLAEYLLCGLPVAGSPATFGSDGIFALQQGGDVTTCDERALNEVARWFLERVMANREAYRQISRREGEANWSLGSAVDSYTWALRHLWK